MAILIAPPVALVNVTLDKVPPVIVALLLVRFVILALLAVKVLFTLTLVAVNVFVLGLKLKSVGSTYSVLIKPLVTFVNAML